MSLGIEWGKLDTRAETVYVPKTLYVALCSRCGEEADDGGDEYAETPEGARVAAADLDWRYTPGPGLRRLVCPACFEALALGVGSGSTGSVAEGPSTNARSDSPALAALAELVRLKDGPRDEAYRRDKDRAWDRAREVLRPWLWVYGH